LFQQCNLINEIISARLVVIVVLCRVGVGKANKQVGIASNRKQFNRQFVQIGLDEAVCVIVNLVIDKLIIAHHVLIYFREIDIAGVKGFRINPEAQGVVVRQMIFERKQVNAVVGVTALRRIMPERAVSDSASHNSPCELRNSRPS